MQHKVKQLDQLEQDGVYKFFEPKTPFILFLQPIRIANNMQVTLTISVIWKNYFEGLLIIDSSQGYKKLKETIYLKICADRNGYIKTKNLNKLLPYKALVDKLKRNGLTIKPGYVILIHRFIKALTHNIKGKEVHHANEKRNDNEYTNLVVVNKPSHINLHKQSNLNHYYKQNDGTTGLSSERYPSILPFNTKRYFKMPPQDIQNHNGINTFQEYDLLTEEEGNPCKTELNHEKELKKLIRTALKRLDKLNTTYHYKLEGYKKIKQPSESNEKAYVDLLALLEAYQEEADSINDNINEYLREVDLNNDPSLHHQIIDSMRNYSAIVEAYEEVIAKIKELNPEVEPHEICTEAHLERLCRSF